MKECKKVVNDASLARGRALCVKEGDNLHEKCRQKYIDQTDIEKSQRQSLEADSFEKQSTRSCTPNFDFNYQCLFCGQECEEVSARNYKRKCMNYGFSKVTTIDFKRGLLKVCEERDDNRSNEVKHRILSVVDLVAADGIYHHACSSNCRTKKQKPQDFQSDPMQPMKGTRHARGCPLDEVKEETLLKVFTWFKENNDEQITLTDLCNKMRDCLSEEDLDAEPYINKKLQDKLLNHFKGRIVIASIDGKANVVTFLE